MAALELAEYLKVACSKCRFVSHKVFIESFCESGFPHKSVNLFCILVIIKDKLTDVCRNGLWQKDFNAFYEMKIISTTMAEPPNTDYRGTSLIRNSDPIGSP